jgi:hypothetical protein
MPFICGMAASSKGHSFILWFILGFFFGVFALLLLAILPVNYGRAAGRRSPAFQGMTIEQPIYCASCDYGNSRTRHHCRQCNAPLIYEHIPKKRRLK